jgi:DNA-binding CsgD family transcriptional regulator
VIFDTSTNARSQAAPHQRLHLAAGGAGTNVAGGMDESFTSATAPHHDTAGATARELQAAGFQALDLLGIGLLVTNAAGQLLVANRIAEDFLNARDGIELDSDGVLCAVHGCSPSLQDLLQRAAAGTDAGEAGSSESAIAVRRQSGKRALTLLVRSARGALAESHPAAPSAQPAAFVMIMDAGTPANTVEKELRHLYGLTQTETRLAMVLMEGDSLEDCCMELGIRRSTGRMHVRNLFVKTGVRRQSELVSLLLRSIGLGPRAK